MEKTFEVIQSVLEEMRIIKKEIKPTKPVDEKEKWVNGIQVQIELNISEKTLYRHRRSGKIPYSRIRGKIYYKLSDVEDLLQKNYRIEKPKCQCCSCK